MSHNITYLTDVYLLTCVVQTGLAETIVRAARDVGATAGAVSHQAEGTGVRELFGLLGVAVETEKQVINIFISAEQRDVVYDTVYKAAELHIPGRGYIYITPIERLSTYIPKTIIDELDE